MKNAEPASELKPISVHLAVALMSLKTGNVWRLHLILTVNWTVCTVTHSNNALSAVAILSFSKDNVYLSVLNLTTWPTNSLISENRTTNAKNATLPVKAVEDLIFKNAWLAISLIQTIKSSYREHVSQNVLRDFLTRAVYASEFLNIAYKLPLLSLNAPSVRLLTICLVVSA